MTLEKICETIKKYDMIEPGDSIVVGLSGGPDSVCLFHALCSLCEKLQIRQIIAVHVNHGLRGAESDADEVYARQLAQGMGAGFEAFHYDVEALAKKNGTSTEDAGRKVRYGAFEAVRQKYGAQRIAVAHNMNDQAETVLMRIMRGTGIHGLAGIEHIRGDGIVIRPVLDLSRAEIEGYCEEHGLKPHTDSTNNQPIYTRNRIRLQLLPMMKEVFNPNIVAALVRLSGVAAEDEEFILREAMRTADRAWSEEDRSLSAAEVGNLHPAVAKRVLMVCMQRCGLTQNISAVHLDSILSLISEGAEAREVDVSQGLYVRYSYGKLWFLNRNADEGTITTPMPVPFDELLMNGCAEISAGGRRLRLRVREASADTQRKKGIIYLDFDKLLKRDSAVFRNRMPGDKISPIGMKGSKKLQDYFTDRKIPKHLRDNIILLATENRVILAGHEVSGECQKSAETSRILTIEY